MQHPLITGGGTTVRAYTLGRGKAVLVQDPDSVGPIKYRYVMTVFPVGSAKPVMFVTAEQNTLQAQMFKTAREKFNDPSLTYDSKNYFLGVFSQAGRRNLGGSPKWGNLQQFESRALQLVCSELGIPESGAAPSATAKSMPTLHAPSIASDQSALRTLLYGSLRALFLWLSWLFAGSAVAFLIYVLVVNPREFFGNILNPLWLVYFAPAICCFWVANWAQKKRSASDTSDL